MGSFLSLLYKASGDKFRSSANEQRKVSIVSTALCLLLTAAINGVQNLVAVPVVEALASLAAEVAGGDLVREALGDHEGGLVGEVLSPAGHDAEGGVDADVVHQVQGPHGVTRAQLHGQVDVGSGGVTSVDHQHSLVHCYKQAFCGIGIEAIIGHEQFVSSPGTGKAPTGG